MGDSKSPWAPAPSYDSKNRFFLMRGKGGERAREESSAGRHEKEEEGGGSARSRSRFFVSLSLPLSLSLSLSLVSRTSYAASSKATTFPPVRGPHESAPLGSGASPKTVARCSPSTRSKRATKAADTTKSSSLTSGRCGASTGAASRSSGACCERGLERSRAGARSSELGAAAVLRATRSCCCCCCWFEGGKRKR